MRRLQLLGKSKNFLKNSTKYRDLSQTEPPEEQRCFEDHTDTNVDSNLKLVDVSGLLSLPEKILLMILEDLDNKTLTTLCLVNSFLYRIISDNCLYKVVKLTSKLSLLRFNALIHSEFHTINSISSVTSGSQNARFLTQTIDFISCCAV